MPCVFPVLTLKVLGFATHNDTRPTLRHEAVAFAAGVVLTFVALGVALALLRAAGEELGWGFQLQSPAVVSALAILFFVLALNLSGVFEFGQLAPSGVTGWTSKNRTLDAFGSGILAVVIASPCTAPFMGAALGYAMTGSTATMLVVFVALGVGHGAALCVSRMVPRLAPAPAPSRAVARTLQAGAGVSVVRDGDLARLGAGRAARQRRALAPAARAALRRLRPCGRGASCAPGARGRGASPDSSRLRVRRRVAWPLFATDAPAPAKSAGSGAASDEREWTAFTPATVAALTRVRAPGVRRLHRGVVRHLPGQQAAGAQRRRRARAVCREAASRSCAPTGRAATPRSRRRWRHSDATAFPSTCCTAPARSRCCCRRSCSGARCTKRWPRSDRFGARLACDSPLELISQCDWRSRCAHV